MRVILVDEQRVFRDTFRLALWHEASIEVVGDTDSARQLYSLIETEKPDLVVSELMLKDTDSISASRELRRRRVPVRIMLLTTYSNPLFLSDALDAGVVAYALKEQPLAEIVTAMQTAARGETYVSPSLAGELPTADRRNNRKSGNGATGLGRLSHREREVFCRIIQGHSSQAIADSLCISVKTVETHRTHINRKLGVRSPVELIRLAALQGLLARETPAVAAQPSAPDRSAVIRDRGIAAQRGDRLALRLCRDPAGRVFSDRGPQAGRMGNEKSYTGGCHCGQVRYEVELDLDSASVISCNCSLCGKAGTLLTFVPAQKFTLRSGEDVLTDYQFNRHNIHHLFCRVCGIKSFARGTNRNGGAMVAINTRCLDGIDLSVVEITPFDGKSV